MSDQPAIDIRLNERPVQVPPGTGTDALRSEYKPGADIVIHNGFPITEDTPLEPGDEVVLICRGEKPSEREMEALMVARHGPGIHDKVRRAVVGVAGCGGLGSALAVMLARTGVGTLVLADFDVVEPSNLNRQQYFIDQIGLEKVEALKENIRRINPYVSVDANSVYLDRQNIPRVFAGCDVLAECFDTARMKREIALAALEKMPGVPLVTVSGLAGTGPGGEIRARRAMERVFIVGDEESEARPGRGLLAPRVGLAAGYQANIVLRLLLGEIGPEDSE